MVRIINSYQAFNKIVIKSSKIIYLFDYDNIIVRWLKNIGRFGYNISCNN